MSYTVDAVNPQLMADLLREQARLRPNIVGLKFEGAEYTYKQMNDRSNQTAAALKSLGVEQGDRVAWLARNLGLFWDTIFGAAKIGAVLTPINWRLAPAEIAQILGDAQAKIFIGEKEFVAPLQEQSGTNLPQTLFLETGEGSFDDLVAVQATDEPDDEPTLDDIFVQLYTSGTTGLPKGVVLSNRAYKNSGDINIADGAVNPKSADECALHALPHFHVAGVNFGLMAIARSMPIIQLRQFDPVAIVKEAQGPAPLNSFFVPAMIMMVLEAAKQMQAPVSSFANVSYGAAPMPEALLDAAMSAMPNADFTQFYGATENCGAVTRLRHEDHAPGLPQRVSAGQPWSGIDVKVCDPENGKDLPVGETGEIRMRSGALLDEYWRRPDATAETVVDGWYRTGDAGYFDENGFLYVCDRVKDMIISGGENIYPAEIENALSDHASILESAVIGVPDEKWGELVKAFVVKRVGEDLSSDDVVNFLSDKIAKFKLPREVEFIDMLPRNASGKILKTELRKR
ncbi:MAG: long-chain-fatty-acid--CoA ligase [Marinicaulis sp.]|nr:long-chain-fatty-acid--CoA ligase [Marinicaulis sp.]